MYPPYPNVLCVGGTGHHDDLGRMTLYKRMRICNVKNKKLFPHGSVLFTTYVMTHELDIQA